MAIEPTHKCLVILSRMKFGQMILYLAEHIQEERIIELLQRLLMNMNPYPNVNYSLYDIDKKQAI
jgi:hypothetical protein